MRTDLLLHSIHLLSLRHPFGDCQLRLLCFALLMLALGSAHAASWKSLFGDLGLDYDQQVWSVAKQWHWPDDVYIVLLDQSDQSSFVLRAETIEGLADIDDAALETALLEGIADGKFKAERIGRSARTIGGKPFTLLRHHIDNPKFGPQVLVYAYARLDAWAVLTMMAWPRQLPVAAGGLPAKHEALLEGVRLGGAAAAASR